CRQSDAPDNGTAQPLVQLARCFDRGEAQDLGRLAPQGLLPFLAPEVRSWPATDPSRASRYDSTNCAREPLVGRGADSKRAAAEARSARVAAHNPEYMLKLPAAPRGGPRGDQRWAVFLRNHA